MLPEILENGKNYTKTYWENKRRKEILQLFENLVYGNTPKQSLDSIKSTVVQTGYLKSGTVKKETVYMELGRNGKKCGFHFRVFSPIHPEKEQDCPKGAVIMINPFSKNKKLDYPGKEMDHMPYDLVTSYGILGIHADVDEICVDDPDLYQKGLWELYPEKQESSWGAIGMWAFAADRVVDYLIMQKQIPCGNIAVCGCSRAGKTALWCAAQDERIGMVISNVSGCTGAAITRGKKGEHIRDITKTFPHWLSKKYAEFSEREEDLPIDQHMLLALCAPRPLYVSSASEDEWADPEKEFESAQKASEIYSLYGKEGLQNEIFPKINSPVGNGYIRYHNRKGAHGCRRYDWEQYLKFIKQFMV